MKNCLLTKSQIFLVAIFSSLIFQHSLRAQVLINADVKINGFRHNWNCNDDATGNFPDPRYKVWVGYNGANFSNITAGPGLYVGGCANTYGADDANCSVWNPGVINAAQYSATAMNQINVDMQSWEEDGCGVDCEMESCGFPTFNSDDSRCGRLRIGDIDFWNFAPGQNNTYTGPLHPVHFCQ